MNFADIKKTWQSPQNRPAAAELESMKKTFLADHDRRRRSQKRFLFSVGAMLTVITLRLVAFVIWPSSSQRGFDPALEWGALLFLLLPWGALVLMARQLSRHDREHGNPRVTIAESVRALLDENRVTRARLKIVAWLHGAILVVLPLVVYQLRAVGKAGDEIMVPAFVCWPLLSAGILAGLWWYDRKKLRTRQDELSTLLRSYE